MPVITKMETLLKKGIELNLIKQTDFAKVLA